MLRITWISIAALIVSCGPIRDMETLVTTTKEMKENTRELKTGMDDMKNQTAKLNTGMDKTNHGVHKQELLISLKELTAPENTQQLSPPALMMPYAQTIGEAGSVDEIIKLFHTKWLDVMHGGTNNADIPNEDDLRIKGRNISLTAASAIAALTPQAKFDEILKINIQNKSRYEESAYAFAACRYRFIRDYMFASVVERTREGDLNLDALRTAVEYYRQMKQIASLPYLDKLKLKVPQFSKELNEANEVVFKDWEPSINPAELSAKAIATSARFERELSDADKQSAEAKQLFNELR